LGTPSFAAPFLQGLVHYCCAHNHELLLVVTQADQPQGRGQRLLPSPVKQVAERYRLNLMQPGTLKKGSDEGDDFYIKFKGLNLDLALVAAYGKIISERLLALPRRGFVNVHASLLPRFRGAAPIQRAILAGDHITGVCLMHMVKGLDEGDIYACAKTPIISSDTSATLFRRLAHRGCALLFEHLEALLVGTLIKQPQPVGGLVYAHMIEKLDGLLDFKKSGAVLCREVRAFDPWPVSFGYIRGKRVKFFNSFFVREPLAHPHLAPGTVVCAKEFLGVKTIDGLLYFQHMQVEGKNILPIKEAVRGFLIEKGERIGRQ
jgi:methionyl-tRNA formyltransferase